MTDTPDRRDGPADPPGRREAPADTATPSPAATPVEGDPPAVRGAAPERIGQRRGMFGVRGSGDTSGYGGLVRPTELPGGSRPPLENDDDNAVVEGLARALQRLGGPGFDEVVERIVVHAGQMTLHVVREHLPQIGRAHV